MKAEKQPPNMETADVLRAGTARDLPVRIIPGLPAQLRKLMCPGFASHPPGAWILYSVPSVGPQTMGRENDVCEEEQWLRSTQLLVSVVVMHCHFCTRGAEVGEK